MKPTRPLPLLKRIYIYLSLYPFLFPFLSLAGKGGGKGLKGRMSQTAPPAPVVLIETRLRVKVWPTIIHAIHINSISGLSRFYFFGYIRTIPTGCQGVGETPMEESIVKHSRSNILNRGLGAFVVVGMFSLEFAQIKAGGWMGALCIYYLYA